MCYLYIVIYFIHSFVRSFVCSFVYQISPCLLVHLIVFSFSFIIRHRRRKDPQMFKDVFKPVSRNLRCKCHCLVLCSNVQTLQRQSLVFIYTCFLAQSCLLLQEFHTAYRLGLQPRLSRCDRGSPHLMYGESHQWDRSFFLTGCLREQRSIKK